MKKKLKDNLPTSLILVGIWTLIGSTWTIIELMLYGKTVPSIEDSIIGFVLMVSLYFNFLHWYDAQ